MHRWVGVVGCLLVLVGCGDDKGGFMEECRQNSDCRDGYVCPDGNEEGMGNIGFICTPLCETDTDCSTELNSLGVSCRFGFCLQHCDQDFDCPSTQPECRGSHSSCDGILSNHWCAQRDNFTCY